MQWIRRRRLEHDADGFTLVEAVVSLTLIAIVMAALGAAMISSVKAGMIARQNQQAGDILSRSVEEVRALGYSLIALDPADVSPGEDGLSSCGANTCITVDGTAEPLVMASGGSINPHQTTLTLNSVPYSVSKYVSKPTDTEAGASYKRLTVRVTWVANGKKHLRENNTLIADTRRGLPLPNYKWTSVGATSTTVNPGGSVIYGFKLTNNGARDTWNISTDQASLGWDFVLDDGDNTYNAATDTTPVADSTGDGVIDTGPLEPTVSVTIWALWTVDASATAPSTVVASFTATSYAEPTYYSTLPTTTYITSGVVTPTPSPSVSPTASSSPTPTTCPAQSSVPTPTGVTQTAYWMHNVDTGTAPSNTVAQDPMVLSSTSAPTGSTLWNHSTDDGTTTGMIQAGRVLKPSTLGTSETNTLKKSVFRMRMTANKTINGTITAALWVVPQGGLSTDAVSLSFVLRTASKSGGSYAWTTRATANYSVSSWGCVTFNQVTVGLPVSFDLKNNDYFDLHVINTGTSDVRLGYGTTSYPAKMVVPLS